MQTTKQQSRRNFLRAGTLLGTAAFAAPALSVAQPAKKNFAPSAIAAVKNRTLGTGNAALTVSALGLGCMGMSYHRSFIPDKKHMISLLQKAVEMGVNFFDTAEAYGPLTNEVLVGEALQPVRKNVIIATKFGFVEGKPAMGLNSRPENIRKVVDTSLKNLRTD